MKALGINPNATFFAFVFLCCQEFPPDGRVAGGNSCRHFNSGFVPDESLEFS